MPSSTVFFGLIQEFIQHPSDSLGKIIVNCAATLPNHSIDFKGWYDFVYEGIHSDPQTAVFLLQFSDFDKFHYTSDAEQTSARFAITTLHIAALLCPSISEHSCYGATVSTFQRILEREDLFDETSITQISDCLIGLATKDVLLSNISLLVSLFPTGGIGIQILYDAAVAIGAFLAEVPREEAVADPTKILGKLAEWCFSECGASFTKASILVSLIDRIVVCGWKLGRIGKGAVAVVVKALRCHVGTPDFDETVLKEHLHITRIHLETFVEKFMSD
jgi:hypothetical protein